MTGGDNIIEKGRSINALYLGHNGNRSEHYLFKFDTKLVISVNSVTKFSTPSSVINRINKMGHNKK